MTEAGQPETGDNVLIRTKWGQSTGHITDIEEQPVFGEGVKQRYEIGIDSYCLTGGTYAAVVYAFREDIELINGD